MENQSWFSLAKARSTIHLNKSIMTKFCSDNTYIRKSFCLTFCVSFSHVIRLRWEKFAKVNNKGYAYLNLYIYCVWKGNDDIIAFCICICRISQSGELMPIIGALAPPRRVFSYIKKSALLLFKGPAQQTG